MQRTALVKYHDFELRLVDGEGDWDLRAIHQSRKRSGDGSVGSSTSGSPAKVAGSGVRPQIEEMQD